MKRVGKIYAELSSFKKDFRKHLASFITGAFAFVAGLLWRDAIQSILIRYKEKIQSAMPIKEAWFSQLFTALIISIVAVIAILLISKVLRVEEKS